MPAMTDGVDGVEGVVRYRVVVTGWVQGVWYRQSCRRVARELGVGGWVRNRADGAVEAAVEGDPAAVEALLDWMRTGPPQATVARVERHAEAPAGDRAFSVR
jgi:acylphosphatase